MLDDPNEHITTDPEQCGGRPCIRGMRIRISDVLDLLAAGLTTEQVIEELPDLEIEDVRAALRHAGRQMILPSRRCDPVLEVGSSAAAYSGLRNE